MRGDQLARRRVIRAVEANLNGVTETERTEKKETAPRTTCRGLETLQGAGFPLLAERVEWANRWAFIDTFQFKVPPPFTLTELMSLYFYRDLVRVLKGTPVYDSLESVFKKVQSTLPPQAIAHLDQIQSFFHVGIKPYRDYARSNGGRDVISKCVLQIRFIPSLEGRQKDI